jgi:predicted esterase
VSKIVNGASLQLRYGAAPKQIVLLLHGFGSNSADMISLAPHWQVSMPTRSRPGRFSRTGDRNLHGSETAAV